MKGHEGPVRAIIWSPDGGRFASVSEDRTIRIWRRSGAPVVALSAPELGLVPLGFALAPAPQTPLAARRPPTGYLAVWRPDGLARGPIIATQSRFDTAVGTWYPRAAQAGSQVAYAPGSLPKYGGVGTHGVQGLPDIASDEPMRPATSAYSFRAGRVHNLESSQFINQGGGFSGAHSDIRKAEIAHAVWEAIKID